MAAAMVHGCDGCDGGEVGIWRGVGVLIGAWMMGWGIGVCGVNE